MSDKTLPPKDEAWWIGFTWGRLDRKAARVPASHPYYQRHDAALGYWFTVGHGEGWQLLP